MENSQFPGNIGYEGGITNEEIMASGMADIMPVVVPDEYQRAGNINHLNEHKPQIDTRYSYGTAGFREHADHLPFIVLRMGYLASLRARTSGKAIGLMITASHNPEHDNGVKIIDSDGEMLAEAWEGYATELVNASDEEFPERVRELELSLNKPPRNSPGSIVVVGRDTRASGVLLTQAAKVGATIYKTQFEDRGLLTTPQLHYIVHVLNHPTADEEGYYRHHALAFKELYDTLSKSLTNYTPKLHLDCANGVGAQKMRKLASKLPTGALDIEFINESGPLNHECGADFVKIARKAPAGFENVPVNERCAVFDGDADRLIYFYKKTDDGEIELLDGDKIALLMTKFFKEHLSALGLQDECSFACVQTAYANGSSTRYMKDKLGITPICVPTGVKHLHREAAAHDCAVYFEANGHGTVTYTDRFNTLLQNSEAEGAHRLRSMARVINKIVGDAMSDLLAVELMLRYYDWSVQEWAAMYEDTPSKQIKIPVFDRTLFITEPGNETILVQPASLQLIVDDLVKMRGDETARAFVRPSGTENIVRVYAEAATQADADGLADEITKATQDYQDCDSDS